MIKRAFTLLTIILCSCNTGTISNIEINNNDFKTLLNAFFYRAEKATNYTSNIISVSVENEINGIEIGLYFAKKLKPKYYIGFTQLNNIEIYFYSSNKEIEIKNLFNRDVKNMTISQGEVLIKLIDRETGNSSFNLVKDMKGGISAFLMQSVARVFGHDLKSQYDPDEDRDIESIIHSTGYYSYQ